MKNKKWKLKIEKCKMAIRACDKAIVELAGLLTTEYFNSKMHEAKDRNERLQALMSALDEMQEHRQEVIES